MGLEGRYVRARLAAPPAALGPLASPSLTFGLVEGTNLEPCLAELVARVLPLCDFYAALSRFVETRSALGCGRVAHAVAAAIRALLQEWLLMVAQLEHQLRLGGLRLQALVYYCQVREGGGWAGNAWSSWLAPPGG